MFLHSCSVISLDVFFRIIPQCHNFLLGWILWKPLENLHSRKYCSRAFVLRGASACIIFVHHSVWQSYPPFFTARQVEELICFGLYKHERGTQERQRGGTQRIFKCIVFFLYSSVFLPAHITTLSRFIVFCVVVCSL